MAKIKGVRNLIVFDPFFISGLIAFWVAQLIRSESYTLSRPIGCTLLASIFVEIINDF